jgi:hypothetical protein
VAQIKGVAGSGTGFLVANRLLATNAHVVQLELARDLKAVFPSAPVEARGPYAVHILLEDSKRDLALLSVESALPPLDLERSYVFQRGDDVTILGNPGIGGDISLQNAVTRGVMSTETTLEGLKFYQLGASVNPGNSGGPVLNSQGRVIGVVSAKATKAEAVGFCIPVQDLATAIRDLSPQASMGLARLEKHHDLRVIFLKLLVAGAIYQSCLDTCVDSMDRFIKRGGTVDDGLSEGLKKCYAQAEGVKGNLESQVLPELSSVVKDESTPSDVRRDLQEMWTTCSDMEGYVSRPRGSFISYRDKTRELRDKFEHLAENLRLSVGLSD